MSGVEFPATFSNLRATFNPSKQWTREMKALNDSERAVNYAEVCGTLPSGTLLLGDVVTVHVSAILQVVSASFLTD